MLCTAGRGAGMVDYKKHRTPGHTRLWDVSGLEVIVETAGEDAWEESIG